MQFIKKTSSRSNLIGLVVKITLVITVLLITVFLLNKIDFPAPKKEIEKLYPMKTLKLLNRNFFLLILIILVSFILMQKINLLIFGILKKKQNWKILLTFQTLPKMLQPQKIYPIHLFLIFSQKKKPVR